MTTSTRDTSPDKPKRKAKIRAELSVFDDELNVAFDPSEFITDLPKINPVSTSTAATQNKEQTRNSNERITSPETNIKLGTNNQTKTSNKLVSTELIKTGNKLAPRIQAETKDKLGTSLTPGKLGTNQEQPLPHVHNVPLKNPTDSSLLASKTSNKLGSKESTNLLHPTKDPDRTSNPSSSTRNELGTDATQLTRNKLESNQEDQTTNKLGTLSRPNPTDKLGTNSELITSNKLETHDRFLVPTADKIAVSLESEHNLDSNLHHSISENDSNYDSKTENKLGTDYPSAKLNDESSPQAASFPNLPRRRTESFAAYPTNWRRLLVYVYRSCQLSRDKESQELTMAAMAEACNLTIGTAQTTLKRMQTEKVLIKTEAKEGRGGWTRYFIPNELYHQIRHYLEDQGTNTKPVARVSDTFPKTSPGVPASLEETELPVDWANIDPTPLSEIGFHKKCVLQIYKAGKSNAEICQESIYRFKFALETKQVIVSKTPMALFMGVMLREGVFNPPKGYVNPRLRALQSQLQDIENTKKEEQKLLKNILNAEYDAWKRSLSNDQREAITGLAGKAESASKLMLHWANKCLPAAAIKLADDLRIALSVEDLYNVFLDVPQHELGTN